MTTTYSTDLYIGGKEVPAVGDRRFDGPDPTTGGVKQSGIGRAGGNQGVLDHTESKYTAVLW